MLINAGALNDVISSTKKFLEENRVKMTPKQVADVEKKLEEAKSKAKLINQRAEESRKDLEKVVTTAIKQESEKVCDFNLYVRVCKKTCHSIIVCSNSHPSSIQTSILHP